jgi:hypothetical protein
MESAAASSNGKVLAVFRYRALTLFVLASAVIASLGGGFRWIKL